MTHQTNDTTVAHLGENSFRVSLSERDLRTLCFLSHCVKFQEHEDAGYLVSEYQHQTADASSVIARTLEVLFEGVRRPDSWEHGLRDLVFPDRMFLAYLKAEDFPGADMARKFLQMGWTRARRYANHKGGRKYDRASGELLPRIEDEEKAAAAAIFYEKYARAREHAEYQRQKQKHVLAFGTKQNRTRVTGEGQYAA